MPIRITLADRLKIQVQGQVKDADGVDEPFAFTLDCRRLDAEQIKKLLKPSAADAPATALEDVLADLASDWSGVSGADGQPVPYSPAALRQLLRIPGLAALTLGVYLDQVSAKAKN